MTVYILLAGVTSGILTGLLSVGGGLLAISLLMAVPFFIPGAASLSMQEIGAMVATQSCVAMLVASVVHVREKLFHKRILRNMAMPSFVGALLAGFVAQYMSDYTLATVYAILAIIATLSLFFKMYTGRHRTDDLRKTGFPARWYVALDVVIALGVAFFGGLVGITGGFISVPLIAVLYHTDIRTTTGTALLIQFFAALGNLIARLIFAHGGIPILALYLSVGGIVGSYVGVRLGKSIKSKILSWFSTSVLLIIVVHAWSIVL